MAGSVPTSARRRIVRRDEERGLHPARRGERAAGVLLGSFTGGFPFRVLAERLEGGCGGIGGGVRDQVDEPVVAAGFSGKWGPVTPVGHSVPGEQFDRVIVLCYADVLEIQQADAQTLITLLHLRDIADKQGCDFAIISEMLDVNNRALAEVARADDFVVSDKLISLMLAQVSENKSLNSVFSAIFSAEGSEIYLKPVTDYVNVERPLNFYTILEAAAQRDEVAIGYRLLAQATDASKMYGVIINPQKSEPVQFSDGDRIIVLANS